MSEIPEKLKITVLGGYGGMGRFFSQIFALEGFDVLISGPDEVVGRKAAREIGASFEKDAVKAVKDADIVLVSVPIKSTVEVIKKVAPQMKDGSLLMDVTSVKEEPCKYMEEYAPKTVEVIGTHPMFSHRVLGLEGQVFVLTPIRGRKWLPWLRNFLLEHKAKIYESTPEEHDRVMAVVQGLTHFTYISIAKTLADLDFNIKKSRKFSSPIYELMLDMVGRIVGQNPELYAQIQMSNPQIAEVHDAYLKTASQLSKAVREKDVNAFIKTMRAAAKNFDDLERAMGRSDKAIHSLVAEIDHLKNSVGREIDLKNIYSGNIHVGVVRSLTPETVILDEYGRTSELKISNLEILSEAERIKYKEEKLGTVVRDYSVIFPDKVDEEFIRSLLESFDEHITTVEVKDVYRGPKIGEGKKSLCFRMKLIDYHVKDTEKKIKKFFESLGGTIR